MFLHVPTLLDLPVLNRELHRVGRKPWLHVLRYGYAAILILQLIILLSASRITSGQASLPRLVGLEAPSILDIRRAELAAWAAFWERHVLLLLQELFWLIVLLTPAVTAGSLGHEKERGTLLALFGTQLRSWEIVIGKLLGRLVPLMFPVLATLPFLVMGTISGGLSPVGVFLAVALLVEVMVVVAGASMLTSVWTRRTSDAILACYASLIVVLIGTLVVLPDTPLPAWLDPGSVLEQIVTCSEHWLPQFLIQGLTLGSVGAICLALAIWQLRPDKRVPSAVPYLFPDSGLVEKWRQRLPSTEEFKIGISWQGNSNHQWDRHRSFPLAEFATIARLPGLRLVSLQKGAGTEQLKAIAFEVIDFGEDLDTTSGAFMDSAAIIKNLDLVITVDSAIAHLAGALGAPVWLGLPAIVDWRWMFQREDSPWYPTMRLFRQSKLGDWASVFERMATEISKLLKPTEIGAVVAPVSPGELIDKLTILEIKSKRITDPAKLAHVRTELAWLEKTLADSIRPAPVIASLRAELKAVNEKLWEVEDEIRRYERSGDFGERFIELARSVCRENDARFALKAKINQLLNSPIAEQKEYSGFMSCAS